MQLRKTYMATQSKKHRTTCGVKLHLNVKLKAGDGSMCWKRALLKTKKADKSNSQGEVGVRQTGYQNTGKQV